MNRIVVILALVTSLTGTGLADPALKVEMRKAEDSAEIISADDAVTLIVTSRSGIGAATLRRSGAGWPARLTIRLKLRGLESLRVENGSIFLHTSLQSPKWTPYWQVGKNEKKAEADGMLEMMITQMDEEVEIVMPTEMMGRNPETISLTWIDFFR